MESLTSMRTNGSSRDNFPAMKLTQSLFAILSKML
ncbi:hypothetical protein Lser_V15G29201 [Lactuca serriola]